MPIDPQSSDLENVFCRSATGVGAAVAGALIGAQFGQIWGAVLGAAATPFVQYIFCDEHNDDLASPYTGINNFPVTLDVTLTKTQYVPIPPETPRIYQPPNQIEAILQEEIYETPPSRVPGKTAFPLNQAIQAREKLRDKKLGCALHKPFTEAKMQLPKCNTTINKNLQKGEEEALARYILGENYSSLPAIGILTVREKNVISTQPVVGFSPLAASATAYAAQNEQLYSPPISRIPKEIEQKGQCRISMNDVSIQFKMRRNPEDSQEPFIEIRTPYGSISN